MIKHSYLCINILIVCSYQLKWCLKKLMYLKYLHYHLKITKNLIHFFFSQSEFCHSFLRVNFTLKDGTLSSFQEWSFTLVFYSFKGVLHPWTLFLKTLCIFSKNKATSDKLSYGSGQKCSKELKNHSFTSVETIVVKLQWKMCKNQYFPCFEP